MCLAPNFLCPDGHRAARGFAAARWSARGGAGRDTPPLRFQGVGEDGRLRKTIRVFQDNRHDMPHRSRDIRSYSGMFFCKTCGEFSADAFSHIPNAPRYFFFLPTTASCAPMALNSRLDKTAS